MVVNTATIPRLHWQWPSSVSLTLVNKPFSLQGEWPSESWYLIVSLGSIKLCWGFQMPLGEIWRSFRGLWGPSVWAALSLSSLTLFSHGSSLVSELQTLACQLLRRALFLHPWGSWACSGKALVCSVPSLPSPFNTCFQILAQVSLFRIIRLTSHNCVINCLSTMW